MKIKCIKCKRVLFSDRNKESIAFCLVGSCSFCTNKLKILKEELINKVYKRIEEKEEKNPNFKHGGYCK